jgi:hypothetical protein
LPLASLSLFGVIVAIVAIQDFVAVATVVAVTLFAPVTVALAAPVAVALAAVAAWFLLSSSPFGVIVAIVAVVAIIAIVPVVAVIAIALFAPVAVCPKPFAGIEEHCRLVKGRSKLLKSDEK